MQEGQIKKIITMILVPVTLLVFAWATWVTNQAFSAQQTEVMLQEHKTDAAKKEENIREEFKNLNDKIDGINSKIDLNQKDNTKMLLNIQQQIGELDR